MKTVKKWANRLRWLFLVTAVIVAVLVSSSMGLVPSVNQDSGVQTIGIGGRVFTIGTIAEAAGTADYTCDGTADDVQFQTAIDALPAGGGQLVVLAGQYNFTASTTVTRAIDNVTIIGVGRNTYFVGDGVTPIFTAGGNNWVLGNMRVNTTTAIAVTAMGTTIGWSWENLTTSDSYYAYRTDDATTGASWNIPVGRGATLVVAANNASIAEKAQADYVCDGTADDVEINAAIGALPAGGGTVELSEGTFYIDTTGTGPGGTDGVIISKSNIWLKGQGVSTILFAIPKSVNVVAQIYSPTHNEIRNSGISDLWIKADLTDPITGLCGTGVGNWVGGSNIDCFFRNLTITDMPFTVAAGGGKGITNGGDFPDCIIGLTIEGCTIKNIKTMHGIDTSHCIGAGTIRDIRILNNYFEDIDGSGILLMHNITGAVVSGNVINRAALTLANSAGISIYDNVVAFIVSDNVVRNCGLDGIEIIVSSNGAAVGNVSEGNGKYGFHIGDCHHVVFNGNESANNTLYGFYVAVGDDLSFTGNSLHDNSGGGFLAENVTANIAFVGNTVRDNAVLGIYAAVGNRYIVSSNIIVNNGTDYQILVAAPVVEANISGNIIKRTAGKTIQIENGATKINIFGNIFDVDNLSWNTTETTIKVRDNTYTITENSNTATIAALGNSIVVNHGLVVAPTRVLVSPRTDPGVATVWWVDTITPTQFTIHCNPATVNAFIFDWRAVVGEGN